MGGSWERGVGRGKEVARERRERVRGAYLWPQSSSIGANILSWHMPTKATVVVMGVGRGRGVRGGGEGLTVLMLVALAVVVAVALAARAAETGGGRNWRWCR